MAESLLDLSLLVADVPPTIFGINQMFLASLVAALGIYVLWRLLKK